MEVPMRFLVLSIIVVACLHASLARHIKNTAAKELDQVKPRQVIHNRQKKFEPISTITAIAAVVGIVDTVWGWWKRTLEKPSTEMDQALEEFHRELQEASERLDLVSEEVKTGLHSVGQNDDITRVSAEFDRDMSLIDDYKTFVSDRENYNDNNQVIINRHSTQWAEAVLSEGEKGMAQIMERVDDLVTGRSGSLKPIRDVYLSALLDPPQSDIWTRMDQLIETLVDMQTVGFSLWALALDVVGKPDEKPSTILGPIQERNLKQQEYLAVDDRLKQWPEGSYGLIKTPQGCPNGNWESADCNLDLESSSGLSQDIGKYVSEAFEGDAVEWEVCLNREVTSLLMWPRGSYCLLADPTTSCPIGFSEGTFYTSDDSEYDDDDAMCCRADGDVEEEIVLPITKPFVMFALQADACQNVAKMTVTEIDVGLTMCYYTVE